MQNFLGDSCNWCYPKAQKTRKKEKEEKKSLVGMLAFYVLWKINNCIYVFFIGWNTIICIFTNI